MLEIRVHTFANWSQQLPKVCGRFLLNSNLKMFFLKDSLWLKKKLMQAVLTACFIQQYFCFYHLQNYEKTRLQYWVLGPCSHQSRGLQIYQFKSDESEEWRESLLVAHLHVNKAFRRYYCVQKKKTQTQLQRNYSYTTESCFTNIQLVC